MKNTRGKFRVAPNEITVYGTVKVGERGQVVIPSEARKEFDIKPGDSLLVVGTHMRNGVTIIKAEAVKEMISRITMGLSELDEKSKRSPAREKTR